MTQHTPGPWTIYGPELDITAYDEAADRTVTVAMMCDDAEPEREANAVLIAAAPAMKEALREAHSALRTFSPNVPEAEQGWTSFDSDTLEAIEAALAAAEGK